MSTYADGTQQPYEDIAAHMHTLWPAVAHPTPAELDDADVRLGWLGWRVDEAMANENTHAAALRRWEIEARAMQAIVTALQRVA